MTILNQYPVVESGPAWLGLLLGLCCAFGVLLTILALSNKMYGIAIGTGIFWALSLIGLILVIYGKETDRSRYECLIDDTTPFVEVVENYEIVGRRGNLWILEDKVDE